MLPARFELHRPASLPEALGILERHAGDASPYAGGTELLVAMKARVVRFGHIVDIKRVPELAGIAPREDGGVSIGPLATHHQLAGNALVRERMPGYAELSGNIANVRVRVAGTVGGNLCFAEPHADPPAMLCAMGATMRLAAPAGERELPVDEFILGELTTARADEELLVRIEVPGLPPGACGAYRAFGHLERPAVGVAAVAIPDAGGWRWRLRASGLCGRPTALAACEQAMRGAAAHEALAALEAHVEDDAAALEAHDDIQGSADFKRHLAAVLARRAVRAALHMEERT